MNKKMHFISLVIAFFAYSTFANASDEIIDNSVTNDLQNEPKEEQKINLEQKLNTLKKYKFKISKYNPQTKDYGFAQIIEFNDLSCYECLQESKKFYELLSDEQKQNANIVYKNLKKLDPSNVDNKALYGYLANDLNLFWQFKQSLTDKEYKNNEDLLNLLFSLGADSKQISNNLKEKSGFYYYNLDQDTQEGKKLNNHTVPMFFINGYRVFNDGLNKEELKKYLDKLYQEYQLKEHKKNNKFNMERF